MSWWEPRTYLRDVRRPPIPAGLHRPKALESSPGPASGDSTELRVLRAPDWLRRVAEALVPSRDPAERAPRSRAPGA